jgi:hypothetical protein
MGRTCRPKDVAVGQQRHEIISARNIDWKKQKMTRTRRRVRTSLV